MKKLLFFFFATIASTSLIFTSCGGNKLTPEQLDSIARAVAPDSLLMNVKDAKYAVVKCAGVCAADTTRLFIQAFDGKVYATNVVNTNGAWENVTENAAEALNALDSSNFATLAEGLFNPEAKVVAEVEGTLEDLVANSKGLTPELLATLEEMATKIYKGKYEGLAGGELLEKMQKGQRMFYPWEYGSEGDYSVTSVTLTPIDVTAGTFQAKMKIRCYNYDGTSYTSKTGTVTFEKAGDSFIMVQSTNVHRAPGAV